MEDPATTSATYESQPEYGTLLLLLVVIVSSVLRMVKRVINIPVVAVTVLWGFLAGWLVSQYGDKETFLPVTDAHVGELLHLYMPVLVFTVALNVRYHIFWRCFWQCVLLGAVGLVLCCCMFVLYMTFMVPSSKESVSGHDTMGPGRDGLGDNSATSALMGFLVCCPEPMFYTEIAFLTTAKSHILETLVMGEALVGLSFFWFVYNSVAVVKEFTFSNFGLSVLTTLVLGPVFGKLVGHLLAYLLIALSQDVSITYLVSLCAVYLTFLLSEHAFLGSGVTSIIALALTASAHSASTIMDPIVLRKFWMLFRYTYNTVIVFLAAFKVGRDAVEYLDVDDIILLGHTYAAKIIVRGLMVLVLYPVLCSTGYDLNWRQCVALVWINFKSAVIMGFSLSSWISNINVSVALREDAIRLGLVFLVQAINTLTLPQLMWTLGLVQMSEAEKANMNVVVTALRNTAKQSTNKQRREKNFSGADWKWVQLHTFIENPYAEVAAAGSERSALGPRISLQRREDTLAEAKHSANTNILRLQKVCYNKQYEDGMIHKRTKTTILAALQYPLERELYLNIDMMTQYITVPAWIYSLKNVLQRFAGTEVIERRSSGRVSARTEETETSVVEMDLLSNSITQGWYHVLVGLVAVGFVLLLGGLAFLTQYKMNDVIMSVVVSVQGLYVLLYALEILLVVYSMGMFRMGRDVWRQLDLIIFVLVVSEFVLTSFVSVSMEDTKNKWYAIFLQCSFILLVACRTVKTLQKRAVFFVWLWDLMDGVLNRKLFYAYDVSWAYITAEDEAMAKASRFVKNTQLANKIRDSCGRNKLQTLKNVIDIQQKYPNIEVATKTRQAARKTLNKALDALHDLHDGGLLDDKQFGMLYEDLTWMIHRVDGMPTNIIVGDTAHCILLSIPWLPREEVTKLLKSFFLTQKKGNVLAFVGHEHERVSIICSGIVKVYGKGRRQGTDTEGRLPNADSNQYFFSEGDFKDYLVSPDCIGLIGFLTAQPSVCQAVCETDVELCSIPMEVMQRVTELHPDPPTVLYRMWFSVAVRVALGVLINHKRYQDWTHDKLKQFLEGGIMPNLYYAIEFSLDEAVQDVILVQGCVASADGQHRYYGPCYLPQSLRQMKLPDAPSTRPRPVMLITTLMRYHLPPELDWYHQPLLHHDYIPRGRTDDEYSHW
ncbi:sperm-specific sodium:proton exchanger-like [Dermacentor andersoni]|uniref:sperm-specific sodium:proton exchanger-like n=2 Tax=Dermacentor TaxID=34619 RepID=UPI0024160F6A|nr:sodium/hydrogen exchanger 10-like [Dermacentor andersoni]